MSTKGSISVDQDTSAHKSLEIGNHGSVPEEIHAWLERQPVWLHLAAEKLCKGDHLDDQLVTASINIILDGQEASRPVTLALSSYDLFANGDLVRIKSIDSVSGVNKIKSDSSLNFGESDITIIYGNNGAGKSGYVRLLKIAAGRAAHSSAFPNVFESSSLPATWSITVERGSAPELYEFAAGKRYEELSSLQVFDEELARDYRVNDRELSFEPPVLKLFDDLVKLSDLVARGLDARKLLLPSKLPAPPTDVQVDAQGVLARVKNFKSEFEARQACSFGEDDAIRLAEVTRLITVGKTPEAIEAMRRRVSGCKSLVSELQKIIYLCSKETFGEFLSFRVAVERSQTALRTASGLLSGQTQLDGVGSAEWRAMWEAARAYSNVQAYPLGAFPLPTEGAVCVLCQQEIGQEAANRMEHFESYVLGAANAAHKQAVKELNDALSKLPTDRDLDQLVAALSQLTDMGLSDEDVEALLDRLRSALKNLKEGDEFLRIAPEVESALVRALGVSARLAEDLKLASSPEQTSIHQSLQKEYSALGARKWLFEQVESVVAEWRRLQLIRSLDLARNVCGTAEITLQKGRLAERLVTGKVVKRFQEELKGLRAGRLPVAFQRVRGRKGRMLHRASLAGTTRQVDPERVLSEGERRVLALAAFLADATTAENGAPFVFDDPISSLDHLYERAVSERLATLAVSRQVIVFTHRLSFASLMESEGKRRGLSVTKIGLSSNTSATGIQGPFPTDKDAKTWANTIIAECPRLRRETAELSDAETRLKLLSAFSAMRRAVERAVESVLLVGIVKRFDPAIHTDNGLINLTRITSDDCALIDRLMTTYSREIHDQADELDNVPLDVDILEADAIALKNWVEEFKKRPILL